MTCSPMNVPKRKRRRAFYLAIALGVSFAWPAKAAEPRWPAGPYTYLVVDQDLRAVLEQFGRNMNLPVRLSDKVQGLRMKGQVGAPSAKAFLQALCDNYQLVWYFDGATIHIMPQSAVRNAYLELGSVALDDLKHRLANSGIGDERFPLNPTGDAAIVSLVAPPTYTSVVREILGSMKSAAKAAPKTSKAVAVTEGVTAQPASPSSLHRSAEHQGEASRLDHLADNDGNDVKVRVLVFRGGRH